MIPAADWCNGYGSWTLGELVDAYEIFGSTSVCNGDTKALTMGFDDEQ